MYCSSLRRSASSGPRPQVAGVPGMVYPSNTGALDGGGPQCRKSILENVNDVCPCRLFSPMSHVKSKKRSHVTVIL